MKNIIRCNLLRLWFAFFVSFLASASLIADDEKTQPPELKALKFRCIGPAAGGRVSQAIGVPGNPLVYYAATASGGVWKSENGGIHWKSIFDDQPISSIGTIAVAPSDANIVYVGSGEANIRGNVAAGNGIYKSTDGGKTWQHVWKQEGQIGKIIIHPKNPDIAIAAVFGHAFGPNPERGIYRTVDGGKTWDKVLFKDADSGGIDVCFDPSNPSIVFAALWQARRYPWELTAGGPGSGLYRSNDGGTTWKQLRENGLPEGVWGRIGVAVAPSDGRRVYALIEANDGGLFRSDDGGEKWELIHKKGEIQMRPWYFSTITVDPQNPNVVYCPNLHLMKSIDGGKTFQKLEGLHHVDHHGLWIDPTDSKRMIDANDGGVDITTDGGEKWHAPRLPISQYYHIAVDSRMPYRVMGNMQDLGTASGPSNSLSNGGITLQDWHPVGGGETGFSIPDPSNPDIVYAGEYAGIITRYDHGTRQARLVSIYPFNASGHAASKLKYRFQWTAPILVSKHDPRVVYHGGNVLFKTTDGGASWSIVSPDLTRDDKSKQRWSGGPITGDNTTAEFYCTIFALAESPKRNGLLWAGTDDGLVHISRDGGKNWTNVTKNIPDMPEWGTVACIEASPFDEGTAYIVVDAHRLDNHKPYLYKTSDFGATWQKLSKDLPQDVYLHVVRCDPAQPGTLYVGTERGVIFSQDDGKTWEPLKLNLPTVPVHDLVVKDNNLVVGTHGRSIWILDDLTPVRMLKKIRAEKTGMLPTPPAIRWHYHDPVFEVKDGSAFDNPPRGVALHYFLEKKANKLLLEIFDSNGEKVRTIEMKKEKEEEYDLPKDHPSRKDKAELENETGLQQIVWDFRRDGGKVLKKVIFEGAPPWEGPPVIPGEYTAKLSVDGKTYTTKISVLPDPRLKLTVDEWRAYDQFNRQLFKDTSAVADMIDAARSLTMQIKNRNKLLKDRANAKPLIERSKQFAKALEELEEDLHNPRAKVDYDILAQQGGAKLYSQLLWLRFVAELADAPPTQGMREVHAELAKDLNRLQQRWQDLQKELAELNQLARKFDVPTIIVP